MTGDLAGGGMAGGGPSDPPVEILVPPRLDAVPGTPAVLRVRFRTTADSARGALIRLIGLDPSWGPTLVHAPACPSGESATVPIAITIPKGTPAGQYPFVVAVQATDPQTDRPTCRPVHADVVVVVGATSGLVASLPVSEPKAVWGRRIHVTLANRGTSPVPVTLEAEPSTGLRLRLRAKSVEIAPGATAKVRGRVAVSRPRTFGQPRRMPFAITVHSRQDPVRLDGFLSAHPWIGRSGVKATAFLAVIALWLGLGVVGLDKLAGRGDKQDVTLAQLSASPSPDASGVDPGSGVGGTGGPGGTGGTGGTGGSAAAGERVTGLVSSAEPGDVTVTMEPTSLVDERIEGAKFAGTTPVRKLGKVPVQLVAYTTPAVVSAKRSTSTTTNGAWSFAGVKAPGYYLVTFAKAGYQTQRYIVAPTPGGDQQPLAVSLTAGRGELSGRIDGPSGPLGGVSLTITDGTVTATTTTPTTGEVGSWSMAGLSTPGTYLVTASAPGYGAESRLVTLQAGASVDGVDLTMQSGVASLIGKVSAPDETGAVDGIGGVTVSVTDGTTTRTATTVTTGPVGSYVLPQLPVPSVYTVTITGDGYAPRTQQVELTAANAQQTIDALLTPSTGVVTGTVTAPDGTGIVGAGLTLSGEGGTYKTMSVSNPAGGFRMTGVTPGSYVLTVGKYASVTQYVAVTVDVGTPVNVPVVMPGAEGGEIPATSHIRGAVVDARTGGVITCDASTAPAPCVVTVSTVDRRSDGDRRFEVTTDPDTPYLLPPAGAGGDGLTPGLHTVTVSAPGYETATVQVQVPLGAIADAAPVALSPAAVITGTLTAAVGTVPSGTCVVAAPYGAAGSDGPDCTPHDVQLTCETTLGAHCAVVDANGNYVIRRLDHGSYRLFVLLPDQSEYAAPAPVDLTLAVSEVRRYDTALNRYGRLVVIVQAPDSNGVLSTVGAGVPVTLTPGLGSSTPSSTFYTGAEGSVTINGVRPGSYRVEATRAPASAVFESVAIGLNQTLSLTAALTSRVGAFRGQVVYAMDGVMRPVPGANVSVSGITGYTGVDPRRETRPAGGLLATDAQGCFVVVPDGSEPPPGSPCGGAGVPSITLGLRVPSVDVRVDATAQGFGTASLTGQPVTSDGLLTVVLSPPGRVVTGQVAIEPAPTSPVDLSRASVQVVRAAPGAGLVSVRVDANGALTWNDPTQSGPGVARPGTYLLRVSLPGYDSGEVAATIPYSAGGAGDPYALPTLRLGAHGGLTVRAVTVDPDDPDRTVPVPNAVFVLTGPTVAATTLTAPPGGTSVTFPDLSVAGGPYQVEVRAGGYVFTTSAATAALPGQVVDLNVVLPRAGAITGTVSTSVAGQTAPLAGITVTATRGGQTFTAVTDADGKYRVTGSTSVSGLVRGSWTVSVQRAGYNGGTPVTSGVLAVNNDDVTADLVLRADKVGVTFVVQTDDATPKAITTATVTLTNDSLAPVPPITGSATGKYTFASLDATQYSLQVVAPNFSPLSQVVTLQVGVTQQTVYITLASRPNSVHGLVSGQRGSAAAQALAAATVTVLDASGGTAGSATTSAQGEYQVQGLPDGSYTVRFAATDYVSADRSIEVRNGQIASVNVTLAAVTHQLTVQVVSESGVTMTGASVTLTANPASTGQSQGTQQASPVAGAATTVFNQVLSGAYTLTTSGPAGHGGGTATVTIKPTDTDVTVMVTVTEQRLRVSVNAVKATGSSTPAATVSLLDASNAEVATGTVLADGTAVFATYLPLGTYQVRASATGYTDASTSAGVVTVSGAADTAVSLTITELGSLRVSVTQDDEPFANATVTISGPTSASALTTSSGGTVTFTGLAPGSYTVTVTSSGGDGSAGPVMVRAGREASAPVALPPTPPTPTPTDDPTDESSRPGR